MRPASAAYPGMAGVKPSTLFPLPLIPLEADARGHLSRGTRQRVQRRRRVEVEVNKVLNSLNWLAGTRGREASGRPAPVHEQVWEVVRRQVVGRGPPPKDFSSEEAARALLKAKFGYDTADASVAPYRANAVSLPSSVEGVPFFDELAGAELSDMMVRLPECYLRATETVDEQELVEPYMDAVLRGSRRQYEKFVGDLFSRGLLRWSRRARERAAVFFVSKKNGQLRMVIDARRANARFCSPPGVDLCSAEGLAGIEKECFDEVEGDFWAPAAVGSYGAVGTVDVCDCFYRLRIRPALSEFFALPPVWGENFGVPEEECLNGWVYPCLSVLPMGFSWSLFFAQKLNEELVEASLGLEPGSLAPDRGNAGVATEAAVLGGQLGGRVVVRAVPRKITRTPSHHPTLVCRLSRPGDPTVDPLDSE